MNVLRKHIQPLIVGSVLTISALLAACGGGVPEDLPTHQVTRGAFLITQIESGEVQAIGGDVIMSPRIGGRLKVLYLFPEGAQVDVGDLVLQFDPSDFEREMLNQEGQLEEATMDYERSRAQRQQRLADLTRNIQRQQAQTELALLNFQRSSLESPVDRERASIELEKAKRTLEEARQDSIAQEVVNRVDLMGQERRIARRRERYERAKRDFERTSIYATRPGIVVYRKMWKRGTDKRSKIAVGDEVWGGRALLDIPDLSQMQVQCLIGEMDLKRMALGQKAFIRLDAFPGPVFHGEVSALAPMASPQPGAPDIRVFEMYIKIAEQDDRLRPGMSAEVEVVLNTVSDVLSVPLSAVFIRHQRPVVFKQDGGFQAVDVTLGLRNTTSVIVESGLEEGDVVALKDPTGR